MVKLDSERRFSRCAAAAADFHDLNARPSQIEFRLKFPSRLSTAAAQRLCDLDCKKRIQWNGYVDRIANLANLIQSHSGAS